MRRKWMIWTAAAVLLGVFAVSLWQLLRIGSAYRQSRVLYERIAQDVVTLPEGSPAPEEAFMPAAPVQTGAPAPQPPFAVDFDKLLAINGDVVGWLRSDDGAIDGPVVRGRDNAQYLHRLIDGTRNDGGTLFMDYRNAAELTDRNTFVYGHNMRDGSMFGRLEEMGAAEFVFMTPDGAYRLTGFAGYVTSGRSVTYQMHFPDDEDYARYLAWICEASEFASDVHVTAEDRIVTLSTCAYDFDDARYVLHCKVEAYAQEQEALSTAE